LDADNPSNRGLIPRRFTVIVFPGTGIQDHLADKARKLGFPLYDFRPKGGGA
jgi:hypothetical protein